MINNRFRFSGTAGACPRPAVLTATFFALMLAASFAAHGQPVVFSAPLEGVEGRDYMIVNYVDHDTAVGAVRDYRCGDRTYDGHTGTDFALRSFRQMDSGVWAVAAAPGRVFLVTDTAFDRNKRPAPALGFGNYVGIAHPGGIYTYYAHLRKGSAVVHVGDSVSAGAHLGYVGSAGNSTDPHVHFEVWTDSLLVDPFAGPCASGVSMWRTDALPRYDSARVDFGDGLVSWANPLAIDATIDTLRERPASQTIFHVGLDSSVMCWRHMSFIAAGDSATTVWYDSTGAVWFVYTYVFADPARYYYFWTYIFTPPPGRWSVSQSLGGTTKSWDFTVVGGPSAVALVDAPAPVAVRYDEAGRRLIVRAAHAAGRLTVELYSLDGRLAARACDGPMASPSAVIDLGALGMAAGPCIALVRLDGRATAVRLVVR